MVERDGRSFIYRIDGQDRIVHVNQVWLDFAQENQAPELTRSRVLGEKLGRFIADWETRHLYDIIYRRIRETGQSMELPLRCDSPCRRRFLKLNIRICGRGGELEFSGQIERIERRDPVPLLQHNAKGREVFLIICGWCKKIRTGEETWQEFEEAPTHQLFGGDPPNLSHGICPECFARVRRELRGAEE